jgi:hypothetical protein
MRDQGRRIAARWLFGKRLLAPALKMVLPDLQGGDVEVALKAVDAFWSQLGVSERPGDYGTVTSIEADWYYALGSREKSRFGDMLRMVQRLRSSLVFARTKGVTPGLIQSFEEVVKEAAWVEKVIRSDDEDSFAHGDFSIYSMRGVSRKALEPCLAALDEAAAKLRPKFPEVLYGKVFIKKPKKPMGMYVDSNDTFSLSVAATADNFTLHAIVHELGHRWFYKFWKNREQKLEFGRLSTTPEYESINFDKVTRAKLADEWVSNARLMREPGSKPTQSDLLTQWIDYRMKKGLTELRALARKFVYDKDDNAEKPIWDLIALPSESDISVKTGKVIREALTVTAYAASYQGEQRVIENFAEAFAHYVLSKPLAPEIAAIMASLK